MKKHILRTLLAMLIACLGLGILAACGGSNGKDNSVDPIEGVWSGSTGTLAGYTLTIDVDGDTANMVAKTDVGYGYNKFTKAADGSYTKEGELSTASIRVNSENQLEFKNGDESAVFPNKAQLPSALDISGTKYATFTNGDVEFNFTTPAVKVDDEALTSVKLINVGGYKVFTAKLEGNDLNFVIYQEQSKTYASDSMESAELTDSKPTPPDTATLDGVWSTQNAESDLLGTEFTIKVDGNKAHIIQTIGGATASPASARSQTEVFFLYLTFTKGQDGSFSGSTGFANASMKLNEDNHLVVTYSQPGTTLTEPEVLEHHENLPAALNITGTKYTIYNDATAAITFGTTPSIVYDGDPLDDVKCIDVGGYKVLTGEVTGYATVTVIVYKDGSTNKAYITLSGDEPGEGETCTLSDTEPTPNPPTPAADPLDGVWTGTAGTHTLTATIKIIEDKAYAVIMEQDAGSPYTHYRAKVLDKQGDGSYTLEDDTGVYTGTLNGDGDLVVTLPGSMVGQSGTVTVNFTDKTNLPAAIAPNSPLYPNDPQMPFEFNFEEKELKVTDEVMKTQFINVGDFILIIMAIPGSSETMEFIVFEDDGAYYLAVGLSAPTELVATKPTPNPPTPAADPIEGVWSGATAELSFGATATYVMTVTIDLDTDGNSGYAVMLMIPLSENTETNPEANGGAETAEATSDDPVPVYAFAFAITKTQSSYTGNFMGFDLVITLADDELTITNFASAPIVFTTEEALPAAIDIPTGVLYAELGTNSMIAIDFAQHIYTDTEDEEHAATFVNIGSYIGVMTEEDGQPVGYVIAKDEDIYYYFSGEGDVVGLTATKPAYVYSVHFSFGEPSHADGGITEPPSVEGKKVDETVTDIADVVAAQGWEFDGWYTKNGEKIENHEYTVKAEDAESGYWITLTARWKISVGTVAANGNWYDIYYKYSEALEMGQQLVIDADITADKVDSNPIEYAGVFVAIANNSEMDGFMTMRYDVFNFDNANVIHANPVVDWTIYNKDDGDLDRNWVKEDMKLLLYGQNVHIKVTITYFNAQTLSFKYEITSTFTPYKGTTAAEHHYTAIAHLNNPTGSYYVGLCGEKATWSNTVIRPTSHTQHTFENNVCSCGEMEDGFDVSYNGYTAFVTKQEGYKNNDTDVLWWNGPSDDIELTDNTAIVFTWTKDETNAGACDAAFELYDSSTTPRYITFDLNGNAWGALLTTESGPCTFTKTDYSSAVTNWEGSARLEVYRIGTSIHGVYTHTTKDGTEYTRTFDITGLPTDLTYKLHINGNPFCITDLCMAKGTLTQTAD